MACSLTLASRAGARLTVVSYGDYDKSVSALTLKAESVAFLAPINIALEGMQT